MCGLMHAYHVILLYLDDNGLVGTEEFEYIEKLLNKAFISVKNNYIEKVTHIYHWFVKNIKHCWPGSSDNQVKQYSPCGKLTKRDSKIERIDIHVADGLYINITVHSFNLLDSLYRCKIESMTLQCNGENPRLYCEL